jgi:hypothetical protein
MFLAMGLWRFASVLLPSLYFVPGGAITIHLALWQVMDDALPPVAHGKGIQFPARYITRYIHPTAQKNNLTHALLCLKIGHYGGVVAMYTKNLHRPQSFPQVTVYSICRRKTSDVFA